MKELSSCSLSRDLSIGFSRSRHAYVEILSKSSLGLCWRQCTVYFLRNNFRGVMSRFTTDERCLPILAGVFQLWVSFWFQRGRERRREKKEKGDVKRKKKEICDYQTTNTNKSSNCIFKMLRHSATLFLCSLLHFYHRISLSLCLFLFSFHFTNKICIPRTWVMFHVVAQP